jgi:signal transduction histidine kinase
MSPFKLAIHLANGNWASVEPSERAGFAPWQQRLVLWFAVSAVAAGLLAYVFTRGLVQPLARFAEAAERFGRDPKSPPLEFKGSSEIVMAVTAFNEMQDRLRRYVEDRTSMVAAIAHDLRTPLTRFNQKLELLRSTVATDPAALRAVAGLEADVLEILRTFDALLQLSEIESAEPTAQTKIADLAEVAARVGEAYRPDIEDSGRSFSITVRPALVHGDGDLLAQGVANLLENALRHTPKGAHVRLSVQPLQDGVDLFVQDDGPGIALENRERAIKPFVRLEQSRHTAGSGLGLAIVPAVAARHAARLSLEDASPGLRIGLRFPGVGPAAEPHHRVKEKRVITRGSQFYRPSWPFQRRINIENSQCG